MEHHSSLKQTRSTAPRHKRRILNKWPVWTFAVVALLLVIIVAARVAVPHLVRDYLNDELADLNDYSGHIEDVDIHLLRGAFKLIGVEVVMHEYDVPVPFLDIEMIDIALSWSDLWQGSIVAELAFQRPIINFVDTDDDVDQTGEGTDWRETVQKLVPIEINHIDIIDGQLYFQNFISDPPVELYISRINAAITNLTNIDRTRGPSYTQIEATGMVVNEAPVEFFASLDPLGDFHDFDMDLRISELNLIRLNSLTQAYANFDFESGVGSFVMELEATDAQLSGYARPLLDEVEILNIEETLEEEGVLKTIWEGAVAGLSWLFRNHPEDRIGAQIEIQGTLDQGDISAWQAFVSILRNAFVEAYDERFDRE